jgi:hypothetical protein
MEELQDCALPEHARNTYTISRVCALGDRLSTTKDETEVHYDEMTFFTHQVNGQTYGAWYRQLGPNQIEVIGAGFLCKTTCAGCDMLSVARSVLEDFLRVQMQTGARPRALDSPVNERAQPDNTPR